MIFLRASLKTVVIGCLLISAENWALPEPAGAQSRPPLPIPGTPGTPGLRDSTPPRPVPGTGFQRGAHPDRAAPGRTAPGISPPGFNTLPGSRASRNPAIDRIVGTCFRPGDIVSASGRYLAGGGFFSQSNAYLVSAGRQVALHIINRTNTALVFKLPQQQPTGPGPWRIALPVTQASLTPTPLGPEIRFCKTVTNPGGVEASTTDRLPEILMALRTDGAPGSAPDFTGDIDALIADLTTRGFQILERQALDGIGMTLLRIIPPAQTDLDIAVDTLRQAFPATTIDVNHIYGAAAGPRRYAATALRLEPARQHCTMLTSPLRIGMLDSGVDVTHPALMSAADRLSIRDFTNGGAVKPGDHGTAVAALLAGDVSDPSFSGLLPQNSLFAGAVLQETPSGTTGSAKSLIAGIDWLASEKADLTVLALSGPRNRVVHLALSSAGRRGMLLLAAAGNQGPGKPVAYPASSEWVFAISAIDAAGDIYDRANRGIHLNFVAPGVDIWVARKGGGGLYRSGTSFAVPHAAAVIATYLTPGIRRSLRGTGAVQARISLNARMASMARELGSSGHDQTFGWGLLQPADCS
ncbi:MAG: hypothetical protein ACI9JL_003909 [Paracoccaceae bacterium]|jgi:hypothetical protein